MRAGATEQVELNAIQLVWLRDASNSPCIRCLDGTPLRIHLVNVGEVWPMCERHTEAEALEAVARRHAMQERLLARNAGGGNQTAGQSYLAL